MTETNEKELIVQEIFKNTNAKITEDDPLVEAVLGFRYIIKEASQDFEEKITELNHQQLINIQSELAHAIASIQMQLDGSNEYYVGNSTNHEKNLNEAFEKLLAELDTKNKDLNFILTKIQAEYDKSSDERFERHLTKIDELHAKELQRQRKQDTAKQREIIFAGAGFIVGIVVCLLVLFVVR